MNWENDDSLIPLNIMARRLRVPVAWLRAEADAGRIPHLRAGRAILVSPVAVASALGARATTEGMKHD
jgi:hypothetical protein